MNGMGRPSMRVWLDRIALAARNLTVVDIENALTTREHHHCRPAGSIHVDREFQVRVARNYQTAEEFRRLVISGWPWMTVTSFGSARSPRSKSGPRNTRTIFRTNGLNSVGFGIVKQATANTVDVINGINEELERISSQIAGRHVPEQER